MERSGAPLLIPATASSACPTDRTHTRVIIPLNAKGSHYLGAVCLHTHTHTPRCWCDTARDFGSYSWVSGCSAAQQINGFSHSSRTQPARRVTYTKRTVWLWERAMCLFEVSLPANKALQAVQIIWATLSHSVFNRYSLGIEQGDATGFSHCVYIEDVCVPVRESL